MLESLVGSFTTCVKPLSLRISINFWCSLGDLHGLRVAWFQSHPGRLKSPPIMVCAPSGSLLREVSSSSRLGSSFSCGL